MSIRVEFDKERFIRESQANFLAPQYEELKNGDLGEWLVLILFVPTLGLFWYPIVAFLSTRIITQR